ncbi:MAG: 4Fe-4S binding protein [Elusimicrobiota bacterium]
MEHAFVRYTLPLDHAPVRWGVLLSVVALLAFLSWWGKRGQGPDRFPWVRWLYRSRLFPGLARWAVLAGMVFTLWTLFAGSMSPSMNPGAVLLWGVWWPLLCLLPWLAGRGFCAVCPVMLLGPFRRFLARLDLPLPQAFRDLGLMPAAGLLVLFSVADIFFRIEARPWVSGRFLVLMILVVFALFILFEEWVWCRQLCPVGAVQAALARFSLVGMERRSAGACSLRVPVEGTDPRCCMCGDCWKGRREPALRFGLRPDRGVALRGEVLLVSLLFSHVVFELLVNNDLAQTFLLILERGSIIWVPLKRLPGVPKLPVELYLLAGYAVSIALVLGLRGWLCALFDAQSRRLRPEEAAAFGLALFPLMASAYAAFHVPSFFFFPEVLGRFVTVMRGGSWTDLHLVQATDVPGPTIAFVRLVLLSFGWRWTAASLRSAAGRLDASLLKSRYRAERLYALAMFLLLAALALLPNTQGDPC